MRPQRRSLVVFTLGILLTGCQWDGSIQLEQLDTTPHGDSDTEMESDTTEPGAAGPSISTDDRDSDFPGVDSDSNQFQQDRLYVWVHLPQELSGQPVGLCAFLFPEGGDPTLHGQPLCKAPLPQQPPGQPYEFVFHESELSGLDGSYFVGAVLYMEGGAQTGDPPEPGVDLSGTSDFPISLSAGSGVMHAGDVFLPEPL